MFDAASSALAAPRKSFRATQYELREAAILEAAGRLLARIGYDAMSMDEIAAEVGIAKGSLYRHFPSKEQLAAAVMRRWAARTRERIDALESELASPLARLRALLAWMLRSRLEGAVPLVPATSPALQEALRHDARHAEAMEEIESRLAATIAQARRAGELRADLADEFLLHDLQARCCDPALPQLRERCGLPDAQLVEQLVSACFDGIAARRAVARGTRPR